MPEDFRPIGQGRFAVDLMMPWGEAVPAEVLVTTEKGWSERPESGDDRWTAYRVGPAVVAVRLVGQPGEKAKEKKRPGLPRSLVPAEWN